MSELDPQRPEVLLCSHVFPRKAIVCDIPADLIVDTGNTQLGACREHIGKVVLAWTLDYEIEGVVPSVTVKAQNW